MKKEYEKPQVEVTEVQTPGVMANSLVVGNGETLEQNSPFFREDEWDW